MPLVANFVTYTTDGDEDVIIKLNYEEDTSSERITAGGFTLITSGCKTTVTRKQLKPRYIDRIKDNKKERVYIKTHDKWVTESKKNDTVKACGECLSCAVLQLIY